jgi:glutamate decarboxylase
LARQLRTYGWQVPAYPLPSDMEHITIMRVVVRNEFSIDLAHFFLKNLIQSVSFLDSLESPLPHDTEEDFGIHHEAESPTNRDTTVD